MTNSNTTYQTLYAAETEYQSAVARNAGISAARDRVKNLLFTYREEILASLRDTEEMKSRIEVMTHEYSNLEDELKEVDAENIDLRKKVKELEGSRPAGKAKAKVATAVVE